MISKPLGFSTRTWLLAGVLLLAVLTWFTWHRQINRSLEVQLAAALSQPARGAFRGAVNSNRRSN